MRRRQSHMSEIKLSHIGETPHLLRRPVYACCVCESDASDCSLSSGASLTPTTFAFAEGRSLGAG
jgi:hypothetical protein